MPFFEFVVVHYVNWGCCVTMISDTAAPYSLSLFTSEMDVVQSIVFLGWGEFHCDKPVDASFNCNELHCRSLMSYKNFDIVSECISGLS